MRQIPFRIFAMLAFAAIVPDAVLAGPDPLYTISAGDVSSSENVEHVFWSGSPTSSAPVLLAVASKADFVRGANGKAQAGLQYSFLGSALAIFTATASLKIDSISIAHVQSALEAKYKKNISIGTDVQGVVKAYFVYTDDTGALKSLSLGSANGQSQPIVFTIDLSKLSRSELSRAFSSAPDGGAIALELVSPRSVYQLVSSGPFWSGLVNSFSGTKFLPYDSIGAKALSGLSANDAALAPPNWDQKLIERLGPPYFTRSGGQLGEGWDLTSPSASSALKALALEDNRDVSLFVGSEISVVALVGLGEICAPGSQLAVNLDNGGDAGCAGLKSSISSK